MAPPTDAAATSPTPRKNALGTLVQSLSSSKSLGGHAQPQSPDDILAAATKLYESGLSRASAGEHAAALARYNRALPLQRQVLGEDSPAAARTLHAIGSALVSMGEDYPALVALKEALHIRQLAAEGLGGGSDGAPSKREGGGGSSDGGGGGGNSTADAANEVAETMNLLWKLLHDVRVKEEEADCNARRAKLREMSGSGAQSTTHLASVAVAAAADDNAEGSKEEEEDRRQQKLQLGEAYLAAASVAKVKAAAASSGERRPSLSERHLCAAKRRDSL